MSKPKEITIDEVKYVRADSFQQPAQETNGMKYVIVRSRDSGCHAGYLKEDNETSLILVNSRRLWYWNGACSLSQIAMDGIGDKQSSKIAMVLPEIKIVNYCEIIPATQTAKESIESCKVWKK